MNRRKQHIRAELYISTDHAKDFFAQLKAQKEAIEKALGYPLEWEELPEGPDCHLPPRSRPGRQKRLAVPA
jgi:phosphopantetheinyl transferase (holo-ACP synthase)